VSRQIESAQKQVEAQNFEMRKNVLKYDDVMNRQRHVIYGDRRKVLEGADVEAELRATTDRVVEAGVRKYAEGYSEDWDLDAMWNEIGTVYPVGLDPDEYADCQDVEELIEDFKASSSTSWQSAYSSGSKPTGYTVPISFHIASRSQSSE
jgi:preprotein translocase subunit SecA